MTPLEELLQLIIQTAEEHCELESEISPKELPAEGGLYAELGAGFANTIYYDKTGEKTIPVLFLCRNKSQQKCLAQLGRICDYLRKLKTYPQGATFAWMDTAVATEPNKIGRDEDGVYHYSCILNCRIYY